MLSPTTPPATQGMNNRILECTREVIHARNVLHQLISQQLILRYRRTALGYLWTLVNPLLMMAVMATVFSTLFKVEIKSFAIFLFSALIPWNYFNAVVTQSGGSFIQNEGLIKKIYIPKLIFPMSIAAALGVDSILSFVVLFLIIMLLGGQLSWSILFIPISFLLLFIFSFGVALIMSIATVFFRDLQHIVVIAMQALFFLSPILYKSEALVGKIDWLIGINPISSFIDIFRAPLYLATMPPTSSIVKALVFALAFFSVGMAVFLRQEKKLVFRL